MAERRAVVRRVTRVFTGNLLYKVASLVVAVVLWAYVQSAQVVEAKVRAAIDWKLPQGLVPTEPLPSTLSIAIQGSRTAVRRTEEADLKVDADLSDAQVGEHTFDFSATEVEGLPSNVKLRDFAPSSVRVFIDEETSRKVRVNATTVGDPATGYRVLPAALDPSVVEIRGPRADIVDLVEVGTKPIDVSGLSGNVDMPVDLELPWGVSLARGTTIRAKITVEPLVERLSLQHVPVSVYGMADWVASPAEVEVDLEGPSAALSALQRTDVAVLAHLPDNPTKLGYEASFGPNEGLRLDVMTTEQQVRATAVRPSMIELRRR